MITKIEFGYVELLLVCGVWLCTQSLMIMGSIFCACSILASIAKFGLAVQKEQQEEANHKLLIEGLQNSGEEFAESVIELISKSKKTVH